MSYKTGYRYACTMYNSEDTLQMLLSYSFSGGLFVSWHGFYFVIAPVFGARETPYFLRYFIFSACFPGLFSVFRQDILFLL